MVIAVRRAAAAVALSAPAASVLLVVFVLLVVSVLLVGSAPATAGAEQVGGANGVDQADFEMPFPCGQVWGASTHADHPAVDWNGVGAAAGSADFGLPVVAGLAGTVLAVGEQSGYGQRVIVDHGDGWTTIYAHLSATTVVVGQRVVMGTQVGNVGDTGTSGGPHLHWEQRYLGQAVPVLWAGGTPIGTTYGSPGPTYVSGNCAPHTYGVSVVVPAGAGPPLVAVGAAACAPGGGCAYG